MGFDEDDLFEERVVQLGAFAEILPELLVGVEAANEHWKLGLDVTHILGFLQHQQECFVVRHDVRQVHQQGPVVYVPVVSQHVLARDVQLLDLHGFERCVVQHMLGTLTLVVDFLTALTAQMLFTALAKHCLCLLGSLLAFLAQELDLVVMGNMC